MIHFNSLNYYQNPLQSTKISQQHKILHALFNPYFHYYFSQQPATGPYPLSTASSISSIEHCCLEILYHAYRRKPTRRYWM